MAKYTPGDVVVLLVKDARLENMFSDAYDAKLSLEVVSCFDEGYFVLVPSDIYLREAFTVDSDDSVRFLINRRFIGCQAHYITDYKVTELKQRSQGLCCNRCGDFYYMSGPNQPDGTMVCWCCRSNPWR